MYLLTFASTLGKWSGIIAAEALWLAETGFTPTIAYYSTKISIKSVKKVSEIATQHAIDSNNPEKVTENLFDCLEFLD